MNARPRTLLATLAAVLFSGVALNTSTLPALSSSQGEGPISAHPSYSPDGREVAFWTTWRRGHQIWAVSTVDSSLRLIAAAPNVVQLEAAWSPTGSWIAFTSNRGGNYNIWLVRSNGSGLTQLTTDRATDDQPAWSPDGTQIAFVSDRAGPRNIWVMNADGSGLRRVTKLACCQNRPNFSPDGSQIVFSQGAFSKVGAGSTYVGSHLWIINADGTGLRQLTTGGFTDSSPGWGARGILFDSDRPGPSDIWMVQPDGSELQAIPDTLGGSKPTWSPDGTRFAFGGDEGIYEFSFLTAAVRPLVELKGYFIPIEIMPGASSKVISLKEIASVRVAILPSPGFDPLSQIGPTSITFGRTGDEQSLASCAAEGVKLVCSFKTAMTGFRPGDTIGILRAEKINGDPVEGRVPVQIVP